jgi:hypothetical protein
VWIGLEYLDRAGPVQVRAVDGCHLIESLDRGPGRSFAPGKDGRVLSWSDRAPSAIRIQGPSGRTEFEFDGRIGAIVSIE